MFDYFLSLLISIGLILVFRESIMLFSTPADKKSLYLGGKWVLGFMILFGFFLGMLLSKLIDVYAGEFSRHMGAALMAFLGAKTIISRWKNQIAYHVYYVHSFSAVLLLGFAGAINGLIAGIASGLHANTYGGIYIIISALMVSLILGQKQAKDEKAAKRSGIIGGIVFVLAAIVFVFI